MTKRRCCFIPCDKLADYEIRNGDGPDDYTDSCLEHVPEMLTDAETHYLYKIPTK